MNQMLLTNEFIDSFVFSQERRQDTREKIENKSRNNNKKTLEDTKRHHHLAIPYENFYYPAFYSVFHLIWTQE